MKLKDWLDRQGVSVEEFAERIDHQPATIHRYIHETRFPRKATLERIFKETNGEVSANDFFDLEQAS